MELERGWSKISDYLNIVLFFSNCSIVFRDGVCCMNCRKLKRFCIRFKRRRLLRDIRIYLNINKRYFIKCEIE